MHKPVNDSMLPGEEEGPKTACYTHLGKITLSGDQIPYLEEKRQGEVGLYKKTV